MWISPKAVNFEFEGLGCKPTDFLQYRWQLAARIERDFPDLARVTEKDIVRIEGILDDEVRPKLAKGITLIFKP
tara:strand:+ start:12007 stop:12228 length:222 start_codon:yes stop_codon:yes gene_type:complete